jgi:hypothetical protein
MFQLVSVSFILFPVQDQSFLSYCSCSAVFKVQYRLFWQICIVAAKSEYYICFKTSKTAPETYQLRKQAYDDNTVFHTWVFE